MLSKAFFGNMQSLMAVRSVSSSCSNVSISRLVLERSTPQSRTWARGACTKLQYSKCIKQCQDEHHRWHRSGAAKAEQQCRDVSGGSMDRWGDLHAACATSAGWAAFL